MPISAEQIQSVKGTYEVFVETGTSLGQGLAAAQGCGFKLLLTVELSEKYYENTRNAFGAVEVERRNGVRCSVQKKDGKPTVTHFFCGDSADVLNAVIIPELQSPAVFFLDAHKSAGDSAQGRDINPLMRELLAISKSPIKSHTILVDDFHSTGFAEDTILAALRDINPGYQFEYLDVVQGNGVVTEGGICVARVPS